MGKRLAYMTWKEFKEEMSCAGDPDAMVEITEDIVHLILGRINPRNIPSLMNVQLVLQRIGAELKIYERIERNRQHPPHQLKDLKK